ncbi:MAG: glycosyl transferase family 2 [Actinomycetia bacterium]|nr:glycosyl transferase family 2 [Actinomycetes bacterium]
MSTRMARPVAEAPVTSAQADVSIVLPYYRSHRYFAETLDSIVAQDCRVREVVVIDDGTPPHPDGTPDTRCEEILARYPFVTFARQDNTGPGGARHAGMLLTSAPYVCFLDCDDRIAPGGLARLRDALVEHPDWGLVSGRALVIDETGAPTGMFMLPQPAGGDLYTALLERAYICPPGSVLFRRSALDAVGGWHSDPRRWGVEDYDVYLRVVQLGPIGTVQDVVNEYRRHPGSQGQYVERLYESIVCILGDMATFTLEDPERDAARRRGLEYWQREFHLRRREHELRTALRSRAYLRAIPLAAVFVLRHPKQVARSVYHRLRARVVRGRSPSTVHESVVR